MDKPQRHHHGPLARLIHILRTRPRLLSAIVFGLCMAQALTMLTPMRTLTAYVIGWNAGAGLYLLLALHMMHGADAEQIRHRAARQDEGELAILMLVVLAAIVCLLSIVAELSVAKDLHGGSRGLHIGLSVLTIFTSWLFTQTMFALHYAHQYYVALFRCGKPGLEFPGDEEPNYSDFFYFAAVIGTSGQTADISFSSRAMRRIGSVHCILSFLFNTTVLAMMINIAAGLF
ncbi:DUF1345 domain-containing protein [Aquitalea sp. USM4]|uniref:DUF1345 domain-containing protein n=1 Tax=Aquitalea sp. USM4 TaxID=1590041 RepID=UPI00103AD260|nr:DUF1345 domain-containing protein [Aquitalea sp. USM4]QBJ77562.1 DUF1345 domain-containing protein [Aquitalea sp. USM4]